MADGSHGSGRRKPETFTARPTSWSWHTVRLVRAPGFRLTSRAVREAARLTVAGELSMVSTVLLDAEVAQLYDRGPTSPVVRDLLLDLTDVTFLDAMAVASLRRIHERALLQGGLRLGLPASRGPRRLLAVAVEFGWLPVVFLPAVPPG